MNFRLIEGQGGTIILDEQEGLSTRKQATQKGISAVLKSGYAKGGGELFRCGKSGPNITVKGFDPYCPKVISNISGFDDIIADRTLKITMPVIDAEITSSREDLIDYTDNNLSEIRAITSMCCLSVLEHFQAIYEAYRKVFLFQFYHSL
ncbi:MAG: hypothetical protein WA113_08775 [Desulfitobacteriaceae bacterium]